LKNVHHRELLQAIKKQSGTGTAHTFDDAYLGNSHPRYAISAPVLRQIAKSWIKKHRDLTANQFSTLITSLVEGESSTEKLFAGILLDYAGNSQKDFNPKLFLKWLKHLEGWAEIDAVCTNKYTRTHLIQNWEEWQPILEKLRKKNNLNMKRASLVFLCTPVSHITDPRLADQALKTISALSPHKEILITKAISWLLRSMVRHYKKELQSYLKDNEDTLPSIAVRETLKKLATGTKTTRKKK
jgi:3-methyladenine DNA glycosylase AlkD